MLDKSGNLLRRLELVRAQEEKEMKKPNAQIKLSHPFVDWPDIFRQRWHSDVQASGFTQKQHGQYLVELLTDARMVSTAEDTRLSPGLFKHHGDGLWSLYGQGTEVYLCYQAAQNHFIVLRYFPTHVLRDRQDPYRLALAELQSGYRSGDVSWAWCSE